MNPLVVYIRKVKKSESKSQQGQREKKEPMRLCISVKLKNLKANHNIGRSTLFDYLGCVYP